MQIGIDSFAASAQHNLQNGSTSDAQSMAELLDRIAYADQMGLDHFGIGEHHREDFLDSAPTMILAAAAARTKNIRLRSAVTVLSAADPVRVFSKLCHIGSTVQWQSRGCSWKRFVYRCLPFNSD